MLFSNGKSHYDFMFNNSTLDVPATAAQQRFSAVEQHKKKPDPYLASITRLQQTVHFLSVHVIDKPPSWSVN